MVKQCEAIWYFVYFLNEPTEWCTSYICIQTTTHANNIFFLFYVMRNWNLFERFNFAWASLCHPFGYSRTHIPTILHTYTNTDILIGLEFINLRLDKNSFISNINQAALILRLFCILYNTNSVETIDADNKNRGLMVLLVVVYTNNIPNMLWE